MIVIQYITIKWDKSHRGGEKAVLRNHLPKSFELPINTIQHSYQQLADLLEKNNGDIRLCEQEYHESNIKEICKITECSERTAKENYLKFQYNIEKAIKAIHEREVVLTTRDKVTRNEIGFLKYAEYIIIYGNL